MTILKQTTSASSPGVPQGKSLNCKQLGIAHRPVNLMSTIATAKLQDALLQIFKEGLTCLPDCEQLTWECLALDPDAQGSQLHEGQLGQIRYQTTWMHLLQSCHLLADDVQAAGPALATQ